MNSLTEKPIKLCIFSLPAHLPVVRAAMEKVCEMVGFDADAIGNVVLSVDEALSNVIKHAYSGAEDQPIEVELTPFEASQQRGVRIRLRDYGRCVDPGEIKSRNLADVRPGGLGVHIINECMDHVEFAPAEGGGTQLIMTKIVKTLPSKQEATK